MVLGLPEDKEGATISKTKTREITYITKIT